MRRPCGSAPSRLKPWPQHSSSSTPRRSLRSTPRVGRLLKRRQPAPAPDEQLVAVVNGENDAHAAVFALGRETLHMPEYTVVKGPVRLELREGRRMVHATLSGASAARLSASLLAILPTDIDSDTADAFLDMLHSPNRPGGPEQR